MGTRGAFGVTIDGIDKVMYNQFDSYPEGLGMDLATQLTDLLEERGLEGIRALAREVIVLDEDAEDTPRLIMERTKGRYHNGGVSTGADPYSLVRELQGNLTAILTDAKLILDAREFMNDSLFCEWAYIANLDTCTLDIYKGFQNTAEGNYGPVAMVEKIPLKPKTLVRGMEAFIQTLSEESDT